MAQCSPKLTAQKAETDHHIAKRRKNKTNMALKFVNQAETHVLANFACGYNTNHWGKLGKVSVKQNVFEFSKKPSSDDQHRHISANSRHSKLKNISCQESIEAWNERLLSIIDSPVATAQPILDKNNKKTTLLHKVLTSKVVEDECRVAITEELLKANSAIAAMKNHHGSLPLHVAARHVLGNERTKLSIMNHLIKAYPSALVTGDKERRTPLHVSCEKFCSWRLTKVLVDASPEASKMKDTNGLLPLHVACRRRCSPKKMKVLLDAYPDGIFQKTGCGETALTIAMKSATKQYPNPALIAFLETTLSREINLKNRENQRGKHLDSIQTSRCNGIRLCTMGNDGYLPAGPASCLQEVVANPFLSHHQEAKTTAQSEKERKRKLEKISSLDSDITRTPPIHQSRQVALSDYSKLRRMNQCIFYTSPNRSRFRWEHLMCYESLVETNHDLISRLPSVRQPSHRLVIFAPQDERNRSEAWHLNGFNGAPSCDGR